MKEEEFIPKNLDISNCKAKGEIAWRVPSNIALVKYWGKTEPQLPANTSISFTLNNCYTETTLKFEKRELADDIQFEVFLDGKRNDAFKPKIQTFFQRIKEYAPFLNTFNFEIHTHNSFPHSSGIASSASGFGALASCLMSLEKEINPSISDAYFIQKSSFLARLGSGSASRSIEGELVVWGEHEEINGSSNLYGVKFPNKVHEIFTNFNDIILLVDQGQKKVSSTVGHNLMHNHPFAQNRFLQANENITKLSKVLEKGDIDEFIKIVESEALTLHAMMMSSLPYFILMKPNTLSIIEKIWEFRNTTNTKVCFTLDAGANVHVLFPETEKEKVTNFITNNLAQFCEENHYICDTVGKGATLVFNR